MNHIDVETVVLQVGNHISPEDGFCVLELSAYLAHEPHSDHPTCVSPVIGAFMRRWNDDLDDETRQRLKPYAQRIIGTVATPEVENARAWLVMDWMVRVHTPAWLDLAGLTEQAASLRSLPELTQDTIAIATSPLTDAKTKADAAWAVVRDAVRAAVRAAVWDAAGAAVWGAVRDAAGGAAGDAVRGAVRAAVRDAVWDAVWDAAGGAAGDAVRAVVWAAVRDAVRDAAGTAVRGAVRDAVRDAVWDAKEKLQPTVRSLQEASFELLDRLIAMREAA